MSDPDYTASELILEVRAWRNEVDRLKAINAELVAALEEVKQFLKPALPYPERDRLFALVGAAIARAKP